MKKIPSKIGAILVGLLILFFGLKGCVVTVWQAPADPTTYAIHGEDGQTLSMIFLPKRETIILYGDKTGFMEAALTRMRGSYGTHYFWRLWSIQGPETQIGLLGYRIYPEGARPVVMETTVLKKFIQGTSKPRLRNEGDTTHPVLLFSDNAIRFEDMWLQKEPTDGQLVQALIKILKSQ